MLTSQISPGLRSGGGGGRKLKPQRQKIAAHDARDGAEDGVEDGATEPRAATAEPASETAPESFSRRGFNRLV